MASPGKPRAAPGTTRERMLDCVERLMLEEGYAAVTYRAVAARAGVTAPLVQYYFPSIDDLFVAAIRRRAEHNLKRLSERLEERSDQPLRVLWESSREEATAALMTEFMALGNHRKSILTVIAEVLEEARAMQLAAVTAARSRQRGRADDLSPEATLFLLTAVPKMMTLEAGVGVSSTHAQVARAFEDYLDVVEPQTRRGATAKRRGLLS